ncbi:MAG: hypothetical protein OEZ00_00285 [Dehalococcoidia bacterium]|nr:hypothetical protein [Dehalococcoidia bacterium]
MPEPRLYSSRGFLRGCHLRAYRKYGLVFLGSSLTSQHGRGGGGSPVSVKIHNFLGDRQVPPFPLKLLLNNGIRRQRVKVVIAQRIAAGAHHGGRLKSKSGMMLYHLLGILLVFGEIFMSSPLFFRLNVGAWFM